MACSTCACTPVPTFKGYIAFSFALAQQGVALYCHIALCLTSVATWPVTSNKLLALPDTLLSTLLCTCVTTFKDFLAPLLTYEFTRVLIAGHLLFMSTPRDHLLNWLHAVTTFLMA